MDIDIIGDILRKMAELQPGSTFIQSLDQQYRERGSLSKKQLEGLQDKAIRSGAITQPKLATLEAIILRKYAKHRSELPTTPQDPNLIPASVELASSINEKIKAILAKYPEHKRVLYFKMKNEKEGLNAAEIKEIEKFLKILV